MIWGKYASGCNWCSITFASTMNPLIYLISLNKIAWFKIITEKKRKACKKERRKWWWGRGRGRHKKERESLFKTELKQERKEKNLKAMVCILVGLRLTLNHKYIEKKAAF